MRKFIRLSVSAAVVALSGFVLLLVSSIYTFHVLTDETLIAEIEFDRIGEQHYVARLRTGDFCVEAPYEIYGDQWRVDAQFLKWHYWASLLGLKSHYRLERIEGRYRNVVEQNSRTNKAHELAPAAAIDIGGLTGNLGRFNFLADASYGSSTYHDIDSRQIYLVYKSPTAIFTRFVQRPNLQQDDRVLNVEVSRGCSEGKGTIATAAGWINQAVDG